VVTSVTINPSTGSVLMQFTSDAENLAAGAVTLLEQISLLPAILLLGAVCGNRRAA